MIADGRQDLGFAANHKPPTALGAEVRAVTEEHRSSVLQPHRPPQTAFALTTTGPDTPAYTKHHGRPADERRRRRNGVPARCVPPSGSAFIHPPAPALTAGTMQGFSSRTGSQTRSRSGSRPRRRATPGSGPRRPIIPSSRGCRRSCSTCTRPWPSSAVQLSYGVWAISARGT
jgi:hypothetical protein